MRTPAKYEGLHAVELGLEGKTAVVTGGSGEIGSAVARCLANEGARVVVTFFGNREAAEDLVVNIRASGGAASCASVDVRDAASVDQLFSLAEQLYGGVQILVNAAGIAHFSAVDTMREVDWDDVIATNLKGTFLCCQRAFLYMRRGGGGDIVNISSLSARLGSFEGSAYSASKAAVENLTLSLALELAAADVRVNAVSPGRIDTSFRRARAGAYPDFMLRQTPQKRLGTVIEIANLTVFLASRACGFITGETVQATGGLGSVYLEHVEPDASATLGRQARLQRDGPKFHA